MHVSLICELIINFLPFYPSEDSIESKDDEQYTPLLIACCYESKNSDKIVKQLLKKNADITWTEHKDRTVLHLAAEYNQSKVTKVCKSDIYCTLLVSQLI